jgi:hypothetical protein
MKKVVLSLVFLASMSLTAFCQVSIDESDISSIGAAFNQKTDTMPTVTPGNAGTGQTWNLSALNSHVSTTINVVAPLTLPRGNRFTTANLALTDGTINNYFFNKSNESVVAVGLTMDMMNTGDTICVIFDQPDTMITFNSVYQTEFYCYVHGDTKSGIDMLIDTTIMGNPVQIPVDSARIKHHAWKHSIMDGEGSLTLPNGTVDALRQSTYETTIDSVMAFVNFPPYLNGWYFYQSFSDTISQFIWWTKYAGNAIVSMDYDSNSMSVKKVEWLYVNNLGIRTDQALNESSVYPNPANSNLTVKSTAVVASAVLCDLTGKVIWSDTPAANTFNVPVSTISNGLYFLNLRDEQGNLESRKVMVRH